MNMVFTIMKWVLNFSVSHWHLNPWRSPYPKAWQHSSPPWCQAEAEFKNAVVLIRSLSKAGCGENHEQTQGSTAFQGEYMGECMLIVEN